MARAHHFPPARNAPPRRPLAEPLTLPSGRLQVHIRAKKNSGTALCIANRSFDDDRVVRGHRRIVSPGGHNLASLAAMVRVLRTHVRGTSALQDVPGVGRQKSAELRR